MIDQQQRGQVDWQPHPEFGLTEQYRLEIVAAAGQLGVRAAAELYRVSVQSVYRWRQWYRQ